MVDTYVGSIDQGTTGTRFMIFDHNGNVVSQAYEKHEQIYPEPGWVEHDPIEIWENTKRVINGALDSEGLDPKQLEAIGITNQRETTIHWDGETGKSIHNALVWQARKPSAGSSTRRPLWRRRMPPGWRSITGTRLTKSGTTGRSINAPRSTTPISKSTTTAGRTQSNAPKTGLGRNNVW